jgi:hypothetical protein
MTLPDLATLHATRRHFFSDCRIGLGAMALGSLLGGRAIASGDHAPREIGAGPTHFPARARRVIFLFMAGGPSQLDLFDYKPKLQKLDGQVVPDEVTKGKRFAFIKGDAKLLGTRRKFARYGESGAEISELLPHLTTIADDVTFVKSLSTDVFNHGPAKLMMNCGSPRFGMPSMGAWLTYGIGSESQSLPGFVVLQSGPRGPRGGAALWASGFLPSGFQGVPFLAGPEPILNLASPKGYDGSRQGEFFDAVGDLNRAHRDAVGDPEISTRIAAYEMAFRMQTSAPDLVDLSSETKETLDNYGAEPGKPSFANNCLLARRLAERGVRFIQLYHTDWDHHGNADTHLGQPLEARCKEVDQPAAALVADLKARGMLDDTIVIFGGEFGRTPMGEPRDLIGRDHHIEAFTMWLAGGGIKPGQTIGKTDELGYFAVEDKVHIHDLHATLLHLLGLGHEQLTYRFQGRDFRLTDVAGKVVEKLVG